MAANVEHPGWKQAYSAAVRRFPHAEFAIRKLISRSEAFRDICEELLEAEIALSNVPGAPPELHDARRAEWEELVDRLVAEVGTALREAEASQNRRPR
ncbi:hypothetical protein LHFGNBLO_003466 [Mesorhizobium sp. AR10]|uniref:hypothetical protein n=1 Tax=Mesorhizobium sp. AR10 TaxID=2865839 RepID=UPI00215FC546|nr:hypothetical protein [Mesorhizobium sp. AR10]UVK36540.1 hypothetical protein LHFGNBLO_003466 [Mesorhizobium sp. AR10]